MRRAPAYLESSESSEDSEDSEDSLRVLLADCLLKVRKVTFSSDPSRKWPLQWLVGENLDGGWRGALVR